MQPVSCPPNPQAGTRSCALTAAVCLAVASLLRCAACGLPSKQAGARGGPGKATLHADDTWNFSLRTHPDTPHVLSNQRSSSASAPAIASNRSSNTRPSKLPPRQTCGCTHYRAMQRLRLIPAGPFCSPPLPGEASPHLACPIEAGSTRACSPRSAREPFWNPRLAAAPVSRASALRACLCIPLLRCHSCLPSRSPLSATHRSSALAAGCSRCAQPSSGTASLGNLGHTWSAMVNVCSSSSAHSHSVLGGVCRNVRSRPADLAAGVALGVQQQRR